MKFIVKWSASGLSPVNEEEVEALNPSAAESRVRAMYGGMDDFRVINVSGSSPDIDYSSDSSSYSGDGGDLEIGAGIVTAGVFGGLLLVLYGMATLPIGIFTMFLGGALGFLSWKLGFWLGERGW